jgi:hypothetical protein
VGFSIALQVPPQVTKGQIRDVKACHSKESFAIACFVSDGAALVAGNADWQEKRVSRCWPSVNGGTSGLEYGAGKSPPLNCQVLQSGVS